MCLAISITLYLPVCKDFLSFVQKTEIYTKTTTFDYRECGTLVIQAFLVIICRLNYKGQDLFNVSDLQKVLYLGDHSSVAEGVTEPCNIATKKCFK